MGIHIDKTHIKEEDKDLALEVLKQIKNNKRVFGNPAEGLKKTLSVLEEKKDKNIPKDPLTWKTLDNEIVQQIGQLKAGIEGEEKMSEYIEVISKKMKELLGTFFFASLSSASENEIKEKGYIPDTDFVAVIGKRLLILDAKRLRVDPANPLFLIGNSLRNPQKEIMELHSSKPILENIFKKEGYDMDIDGYTVIISDQKPLIFKNEHWYENPCRPIWIGELTEKLKEWVESTEDKTCYLNILTLMSKMQIKQEKSDIKFENSLSRFL